MKHTEPLACLLFSTVFLLMPFACKSSRKSATANPHESLTQVTLTMLHHLPYCKGIPPPPFEDPNPKVPEVNQLYVLTKKDNENFKVRFTTDSAGQYSTSLPEGIYCIKSINKDVDFETFIKNYKGTDNDHVTYGSRECYQNWWQTCEGEFEITASNTKRNFTFVSTSWCFTGKDPCKQYRGPLPP